MNSGFNVVAVSMDGGPNREFPNYVVDVGQHAKMGLTTKATPTLVLYDTVTRRPIPIGTGILSADDITERIRSEEHTSELQSLMRSSNAVFCLKKKNIQKTTYV